MRASQRLLALLLFAAVSLLALACSGLVDWLTSSLFLVLEILAGFLHRMFGLRQAPRAHARQRPGSGRSPFGGQRPRRLVHRKPGRGRKRAGPTADQAPEPAHAPKVRLLLPLCADQPELIEFALEECLARKAELLLLFFRPLAVIPMGPNPIPKASEDGAATAIFERVRAEAREAGVTLQTFYEVTSDRAATILAVARNHQADILLMEATRRRRFWNPLAGDMTRAVLSHLPEHVSLIVHAA